jgi:AcrR family transcriptional regulator
VKARKSRNRPVRRRHPRQDRAQQTVEAILDGVVRILKREGFAAITTNHIAEIAGVSIGSLYQYFPDKSAIFVALHGRHIEEIDRVTRPHWSSTPLRRSRA